MEKIGDKFSWLPFVLQTSDPLFPTGAYAHSLGLEEMVRLGGVSDETSLRDFLRTQIVPALAEHELPYLRFARAAAESENLAELCTLDREIGAWKICHELRAASIQLGSRRLKMLLQIFPSALLQQFENCVTGGEAAGHQLVVCGLQFAALPLEAALGAYFYQTLAAHVTAALKLVRIGQAGCQRVLSDCLTDATRSMVRSLAISRSEAGWFNPMLEIASMRHERAFARLFIS